MIRSIYTFAIYCLIFIPSILLTALSDKYSNKKNKTTSIILGLIALLIPSIFAGFRGEKVGTDILTYAVPEFRKCFYDSSVLTYLSTTTTDIGYALIVAISAKVFKSVNFLLFITAFLQILPVYLSAFVLKKRLNVENVMLSYYFLYYIMNFNIMRQSIAAGFLMLFFLEIINKRYLKALFSLIIALLFHSTAIIGIALIIVGLVIYNIKKRWPKDLIIIGDAIIVIVAMFQWRNIATFIISLGVLPKEKFQVYIDVFSGVNVGEKAYMFDIALSQYFEVYFRVVLFLVAVICLAIRNSGLKNITLKIKNDKLLYSVLSITLYGIIIDLIFLYMFHSPFGYRISLFAEYFLILLLPLTSSHHNYISLGGKHNTMRVTINELICNISLFISFYILYMVFGEFETLPLYFQIYTI